MEIKKTFLTENPCYTAGRTITPKGIMLHSVGCAQPSAEVFVSNWNRASYTSACVHAFIDGNTGDVYQTLPWNMRGWHSGAAANNTHISIEMCEPANLVYGRGATFTCKDPSSARKVTTRTYHSAVELCAELCKMYELDPMKDGVIISHYEGHLRGIASDHSDPEHLWNQLETGYTMDKFRKDVKAAMQPAVSTGEPAAIYRVQAGAFKSYANAVAHVDKLKAAGFDAFIIEPTTDKEPEQPKLPKAGTKIQLTDCKLYNTSTAKAASTLITGTYYYWDDKVLSHRRRITNKSANVGKANAVTGWIDV